MESWHINYVWCLDYWRRWLLVLWFNNFWQIVVPLKELGMKNVQCFSRRTCWNLKNCLLWRERISSFYPFVLLIKTHYQIDSASIEVLNLWFFKAYKINLRTGNKCHTGVTHECKCWACIFASLKIRWITFFNFGF